MISYPLPGRLRTGIAKAKNQPSKGSPTMIPAALQHTQCILALSAVRACLEVLTPAVNDTALAPTLAEISALIERAAESTRRKKLSAGARRDLDNRFRVLGPYIETERMPDAERFDRWAAIVWCAATLLLDARITCPAYAASVEWGQLVRTMDRLAEALAEMSPGADEAGTEIYLMVA